MQNFFHGMEYWSILPAPHPAHPLDNQHASQSTLRLQSPWRGISCMPAASSKVLSSTATLPPIPYLYGGNEPGLQHSSTQQEEDSGNVDQGSVEGPFFRFLNCCSLPSSRETLVFDGGCRQATRGSAPRPSGNREHPFGMIACFNGRAWRETHRLGANLKSHRAWHPAPHWRTLRSSARRVRTTSRPHVLPCSIPSPPSLPQVPPGQKLVSDARKKLHQSWEPPLGPW